MKRMLGAFALVGFLIAVVQTIVAWPVHHPFVGPITLVLFPPSMFWVSLDLLDHVPVAKQVMVFASAIAANTLLYAVYGCICYYGTKLFCKAGKIAKC